MIPGSRVVQYLEHVCFQRGQTMGACVAREEMVAWLLFLACAHS